MDLRKSLFILPNLFTVSSIFCGFNAIRLLSTAESPAVDPARYQSAALLLVFAMFFDIIDGRVARLTKTQSAFGVQIDSLADVVSFGVAPAVLGFTLGLRGGWDTVVLLYFVACGISRLARYNATAEELSAGQGKVAYYEGTPIPTSLGIVLVLGIAFWMDRTGDSMWWGVARLGPFELHPLVSLYALSGSLMISTFRIPKP